MFRTKHSACLIVMLALVVCSSALAQETRATLLGRVIDATGGVLPGVSIIVTNTDTNVSNHLVTNDEGLYRVPFLMPGPYQVTAELSGFKTYVRKGITLSINTEAVVDVKMEVGEMSQSVTVTAEEPLLNTTSATVAQVIDNKRVMELPILGNSAMLMSGLAFGMQRGSARTGTSILASTPRSAPRPTQQPAALAETSGAWTVPRTAANLVVAPTCPMPTQLTSSGWKAPALTRGWDTPPALPSP